MKKKIFLASAVVVIAAIIGGSNVLAADEVTYEITVTNLMRGQPLAPPLVVAHNSKFNLFIPGKKSVPQLGILAETGNPGPLADRVDGKRGVLAVATGDHITQPANSITLTVTVSADDALLSVASMLGVTNDAFASIRNMPLVDGAVYFADAWDAGSEENTEAIGDVGALGGGNGRRTANAEKFIHIHSGIFGKADMDPAVYDWRNPVAMITVKEVK